ncbi:hypothetical protein BGZ49_001195 [Haplosporangium sp. Z 27]|nr:hypothetical protein BGZ49_001195 [Haplosporangium sp. Z 27]
MGAVSEPAPDDVPQENQPTIYRTYKTRYVGLSSIVLLNIATGFVWLTYSSVSDIAMDYFSCSSTVINLTSILYFIAYIIMTPVSGWMFEKHGIKRALLFGAGIQIVGSWLRYFADFIDSTPDNPAPRLAVVMIGQIIASAAQPFFLNVPPKFAAVWFSENGRTTATMIGSVSNAFAAALAQLIIPVITTDKASMNTSVLFCAIFSTVSIIPAFFVADHPPTPPSPSAAEALRETNEEPFWISLKKFSAPYGYSASTAGYFGAAMVVAGLVGAGISGPLVDKYKCYKLLCKALVPLSSLLLVAFVFVLRENDLGGIIAISVLIGLSAFSVLPAALELAVEITYPVTPASSTSLMWAFGQLVAVVFLVALGALQNDELSRTKHINPPMIFMAAWSIVFGVIPVFMINSSYLRMEAEEASRKNDVGTSSSAAEGKSGDKEEIV